MAIRGLEVLPLNTPFASQNQSPSTALILQAPNLPVDTATAMDSRLPPHPTSTVPLTPMAQRGQSASRAEPLPGSITRSFHQPLSTPSRQTSFVNQAKPPSTPTQARSLKRSHVVGLNIIASCILTHAIYPRHPPPHLLDLPQPSGVPAIPSELMWCRSIRS